MESPIRFAIVGCGRVAGNHLDAIQRLPRATIAAVCDLDAGRTKMYSDTFGVRWYTNYHEMLVAEQVDVVSIVTPSGMHLSFAKILSSLSRCCFQQALPTGSERV